MTRTPATSATNNTVVVNKIYYTYRYTGCWCGIWWGPSYGWWIGYGPYIGYWPSYGNVYWDGQPKYAADKKTGIKLDLAKNMNKDVREKLENGGMVEISKDGGVTWSRFESVEELTKHSHHLDPGTYGVRIALPDGNTILEGPVIIEQGEVAHLSVGFDKNPPNPPRPVQS